MMVPIEHRVTLRIAVVVVGRRWHPLSATKGGMFGWCTYSSCDLDVHVIATQKEPLRKPVGRMDVHYYYRLDNVRRFHF